jgi:hypothetical protein
MKTSHFAESIEQETDGMRTKLNLDGSNRRVAERLGMPGLPTSMPMEWLDAGNWRLPSGKALAEFALQAGFLAPLLFRTERVQGEASLGEPVMPARTKHFGKGSNR